MFCKREFYGYYDDFYMKLVSVRENFVCFKVVELFFYSLLIS